MRLVPIRTLLPLVVPLSCLFSNNSATLFSFVSKCKDPNITTLYGSCRKDKEIWIMMEYCGLGSVLDVIRRRKISLTEPLVACIVQVMRLGDP